MGRRREELRRAYHAFCRNAEQGSDHYRCERQDDRRSADDTASVGRFLAALPGCARPVGRDHHGASIASRLSANLAHTALRGHVRRLARCGTADVRGRKADPDKVPDLDPRQRRRYEGDPAGIRRVRGRREGAVAVANPPKVQAARVAPGNRATCLLLSEFCRDAIDCVTA